MDDRERSVSEELDYQLLLATSPLLLSTANDCPLRISNHC